MGSTHFRPSLPRRIDLIVQPVRDALDYYRRLNEATREERLHRKSIVELVDHQNTPVNQSPDSGNTVSKSNSASSVKMKKSLSFQQTRSRSRSTDDETENDIATIGVGEGISLEDVQEDPESGDSETATEVEVSEKALKFKISTESSIATTGRKSYPGSRKGSRERVQHLNHSEIAKMMQKGKLRCGGFSFDQHCLVGNKKLTFDTPEFLDEYTMTLKKKFEEDQSDSEEENNKLRKEGECVLSKETLNLNKRNSEHSVKVPTHLDEKRSILKCSENKTFTNAEKLKMNNSSQLEDNPEPQAVEEIVLVCPTDSKRNSIKNNNCKIDPANKDSDSSNSILVQNEDVKQEEPGSEARNNRSIFSRFRQLTDRFGLSNDREQKVKTTKNNNCSKSASNKSKKLQSACCKSLEEVGVRKASTLPKTRNVPVNKRSWKFLALGKDKRRIEGWASDAAVDMLTEKQGDLDNQSLPSTSQLQSNCASPNFSSTKSGSSQTSPRKNEFMEKVNISIVDKDLVENNVVDKCIIKLQDIHNDESLAVNEKDPNLI